MMTSDVLVDRNRVRNQNEMYVGVFLLGRRDSSEHP